MFTLRFRLIAAIFCFFSYAVAEIEVPNFADNPESVFDLRGDFLIWYASEETSSCWKNQLTTTLSLEGIQDIFGEESLAFDWNYGFRVGIGTHLAHDQWDSQLYWSWYQTRGKNNASGGEIIPQFFGAFLNGDIANAGKINWNLLYNIIDWELGRSYWVSEALLLRPFIGLKGGWIHQMIDSKWDVVSPSIYLSSEDLQNRFWGIGPSGGVNTKWKLGNSAFRFLSLLGDFSGAILWGTWNCTDHYQNALGKNIYVNTKPMYLGSLALKGFMGFGWETHFDRSGARFSLEAGYEAELWINQLRIPTFQQLCLHGDLTLQGGRFSGKFDF